MLLVCSSLCDQLYLRPLQLTTRLDRPWAPPSHLFNGYQAFPGCKAAGAWR
jgi:hypothetical protein